jgi:GNAT superfamily N-acetyltransferase
MFSTMEGLRVPLVCDTALAARIERAETELIAAATRAAGRRRVGRDAFTIPVAGGVAGYAEPDSPFNKVAGLGFGGVPTFDELEAIEAAFSKRGAEVQVELSNLGDPLIGARLTERGYRLTSFENVLGRSVGRDAKALPPPDIEVRPSGEHEFGAWLDVVVDGFAHPDLEGVPSHESFPREALERAERDFAAAGVMRYAAVRNGVLVGAGSLRIAEGIAQFAGAATAPAHRRQGVQTALIASRLADAAAAGCDVAVVTTQPGSRSQQNMQRRGFDLLYTRAVLVKPR